MSTHITESGSNSPVVEASSDEEGLQACHLIATNVMCVSESDANASTKMAQSKCKCMCAPNNLSGEADAKRTQPGFPMSRRYRKDSHNYTEEPGLSEASASKRHTFSEDAQNLMSRNSVLPKITIPKTTRPHTVKDAFDTSCLTHCSIDTGVTSVGSDYLTHSPSPDSVFLPVVRESLFKKTNSSAAFHSNCNLFHYFYAIALRMAYSICPAPETLSSPSHAICTQSVFFLYTRYAITMQLTMIRNRCRI